MKEAISIPDDVFERAEREAQRLGISSSELFTRAVRQFLVVRHDDGEAARRTRLDIEWWEE
jgi:hypothetical protein